MFTLEALNTVFMRKADAAKRLGLNAWQLNLLIATAKLSTPKLAGSAHLYTADVERLAGSPLIEAVRTKSTEFEGIATAGAA